MYFDQYRIADHPELSSVCDLLIAEHPPVKRQSRFKYAMKVMVINLYHASESDPLCIRVNRKAWANNSFRHDHIRSIVNFMEAHEYCTFKRGYSFASGESRPSTLVPTQRLRDLFDRLYGMQVSYDVGLAPFVFLRDKRKMPMEAPTTVLRHRMERNAGTINHALIRHIYTVHSPISDPKSYSGIDSQLDTTQILFFVRRVFSRGMKRLTHGGRFYTKPMHIGLHPQGLSGAERRTIRIDGEPSVELDFSAYHIRLLMALDGVQLDGDPYTLVDAPRHDVKLMQLIAINAKDRKDALGAFQKDTGYSGASVYDAIVKTFPILAKHFGADRGILLQRLDSDIAEDIMLHFARTERACIPIHDSFIVKERYSDELRQAMCDAYAKHTGGFHCPIK